MKGFRFLIPIENKVFLIVALTTVACSFAMYGVLYTTFYSMMIEDIRQRTATVNLYAQGVVPISSFSTLNVPQDSIQPIYQTVQTGLNSIRHIANVRYLFTAKNNPQGQPIYVVDGLEPESADFRNTGDLIEAEIRPLLNQCLQGEAVDSGDILNTEWGVIFITCWPVKDEGGNTVGATVMEFDTEQLYMRNRSSRIYSLLICIGLGALFLLISRHSLKKISEPFYKKLAYTDMLTGLNNRTAFELDLERYADAADQRTELVVIMYDLDRLKMINDEQGHAAGDVYIKKMAELIRESTLSKIGTMYRIGGDEFATIIRGHTDEELHKKLEKLHASNTSFSRNEYFSFSYGMARFDVQQDRNLHDVLLRADAAMYAFKNQHRSQDTDAAMP